MIALAAIGVAVVALVLLDAFETIVLPKRVGRPFRLARVYYRVAWATWRRAARRAPGGTAPALLDAFGPASLPMLVVLWAACLITGFGLIYYGLDLGLEGIDTLSGCIYFSGVCFFTLGLGDIVPTSSGARFLAVLESGVGFGFLALVVGYLPVIYQAFARRESGIGLLDARAGSPPVAFEFLATNSAIHDPGELLQFLRDWERWCADLMESHLSYPVLAYFRSHHDRQSWLAALTAVLDLCALIEARGEGPCRAQAALTFAIARHAAVDLSQLFGAEPVLAGWQRFDADAERAAAGLFAGSLAGEPAAALARLAARRALYEPYVGALSRHLELPLPPWWRVPGVLADWQTTAE